MSGSVSEVFFITGAVDNVPRGGIDSTRHHPRPDLADTGLLGTQDNAVNLFLARRCLADYDRAGHIRDIPVIRGPEIERDKIAFGDLLLGRDPVRKRGAIPRRHDSFERNPFGAKHFHLIFQFRADFYLTDSRFQNVQNPLKGKIADIHGLLRVVDFVLVLDHGEILDRIDRRD